MEFRGFSYGFRPGRSPHQALDALAAGLCRKRVNWIVDADIQGFFDNLSHEWMLRFLEHRIADTRILRLIQKWLKARSGRSSYPIDLDVFVPDAATRTFRSFSSLVIL